jgi:hypothetical protein
LGAASPLTAIKGQPRRAAAAEPVFQPVQAESEGAEALRRSQTENRLHAIKVVLVATLA